MQSFFSFLGQRRGNAWLWAVLLLTMGWLRPEMARASHIRAGDIQAQVDSITGNPNHIYFKLTVYRDLKGVALLPATVYFGDGTQQIDIPIAKTVDISGLSTSINTFYFDHTYGAAGRYVVSYVEDNRNDLVINMASSSQQSFYINSSITINPAYGRNHSPVLRAPAIDRAATAQVFLHNPAGYDADGDSLAYHLRTCQQVAGGKDAVKNSTPLPVVCTGYVYPNDQTAITPRATQVAYSGTPVGVPNAPAIIVQDPQTGQITWNAPSREGIYNIAFVVEEWRRTSFGHTLIGSVIRDMQIIVTGTKNLPPTLTVPSDICVVANKNVTFNVSAVDGSGPGSDAPSPVTLFAYSGILPPATFKQNNTGTSVTGTFSWTPDCSKVSGLPYVVVFKAQDSPPAATGSPILIDEKPVRITVVGPPPQNLKAVSLNGTRPTSVLSWDTYTCTNASRILIFRRENCYAYTPGPCDTGLPASAGYVQVGSVPVTATTFSDDNNGNGLVRGRTYSYRIYATFDFPANSNSIASNEACLSFNGRAAKLTNVDVLTTELSTGQIALKWTQPRNNNDAPFGAPYGYRISRAEGNSQVFAPVVTITNLKDTTYVDRGLNTTINQYTYQLTFFNTSNALEQTETAVTASSVRASLVPDGLAKTITVNWAQQVPWDNTRQPAQIFRKDPGSTTFNRISTAPSGASSGTYVDKDPTLVRGQTYCYYVQTNGQYPDVNSLGNLLYTNLLNNSQQQCVALQATPCTPVLSLRPTNCDSLAALPSYPAVDQRFQNYLRWTVGTTPAGCDVAAAYYRILRRDGQNGPYVAIDSTTRLDYADRFLRKATYCYIVQAVSSAGIRSTLSNSVCQDDCVFFLLPNIFTPNGDGINDVFKPKTASGVLHTHIQVFNRWGRKVYEGDQDPYINWTGGGTTGESSTSGMVSGGLYYYLAEVQFDDLAQTKRTIKGWVEIIR